MSIILYNVLFWSVFGALCSIVGVVIGGLVARRSEKKDLRMMESLYK